VCALCKGASCLVHVTAPPSTSLPPLHFPTQTCEVHQTLPPSFPAPASSVPSSLFSFPRPLPLVLYGVLPQMLRPKGETLPDHLLPEARTCFFSVLLPTYSSPTILKERLQFAISQCRCGRYCAGMGGGGGGGGRRFLLFMPFAPLLRPRNQEFRACHPRYHVYAVRLCHWYSFREMDADVRVSDNAH
jgi:hypothetical protein